MLFKLPKISSCFYCCSLKTGSVIIGSLQVTCYLILILHGLWLLCRYRTLIQGVNQEYLEVTGEFLSFLDHCDQESAKHLEQPKVVDPPPASLLPQALSIPQLREDKGRTSPLLPLPSTSWWTTYPLMSNFPEALGLRTSFKDSQGEYQDDMEPTASPAPPVLHPVPSQLFLHIGVRAKVQ